MQINNINFGSNFRIDLHAKNKKVSKNEDFIRFMLYEAGVDAKSADDLFKGKSYNIKVPNKKDGLILDICEEFHIPYKKVNTGV
ncbi:MAG: hypothetical protein MJ180_03815 [Candidatus Gastranaerophilales bacterium]|nr:hypothetical protein [Candidatus Gastranaerophilales bacterium]